MYKKHVFHQDATFHVLFVKFWWSASWLLIILMFLITSCTDSRQTIVAPTNADFSGASIGTISYPGLGMMMVVTINVPGGVDGEYCVLWDGEKLGCATPVETPNQLRCLVPLLPSGDQGLFKVHSVGMGDAVFQFTCRTVDPIDKSSIPEMDCWAIH